MLLLLLLLLPAVCASSAALYSPATNSVYIYYSGSAHLLLLPLTSTHFTVRNITKAVISLPVPSVISPGDLYHPLLIPSPLDGGDEFYLLGASSAGDPVNLFSLTSDASKPRWVEHPLISPAVVKENSGAFVDGAKGGLYMFGGLENVTLSSRLVAVDIANHAVKTLDEDSSTGKWIVPTAGFAVAPLPGRNVAMIGGFDEKDLFLMEEVAVLSLDEMAWTLHPVTSEVEISPRVGHSAAVTADGKKVLLFGGWQENTRTPATPPLVLLDMTADTWRWEVPEHQPAKCYWDHGAVMLPGDVVLITGGQVRANATGQREDNREVLLYSVAEDRWVESYPPPPVPEIKRKAAEPEEPAAEEKKLPPGAVAGIAIGVALGLCALIAGIATICLRRRRHRRSVAAAKRMSNLLDSSEGGPPKSQLRPSNPTSRVPSLDLSDESDAFTPRSAENPFEEEEYELPELKGEKLKRVRDAGSECSFEVGVPVTMRVLKGRAQVVEVGSQASVRGSVMEEVEEGHGDGLSRWKTANDGSERLMDSGDEAERSKGKRGK
jgi:hypothetical protein